MYMAESGEAERCGRRFYHPIFTAASGSEFNASRGVMSALVGADCVVGVGVGDGE